MRAVRRLFTEGLQAAAAIVFQRRAVNQRVRLRVAQRRLARALGEIVFRLELAVQAIVPNEARLAVRAVFVFALGRAILSDNFCAV